MRYSGNVENHLEYLYELYSEVREKYLAEKADKNDPAALCLLGLHRFWETNPPTEQSCEEAFSLLQKAADLGCGDAYYYLGQFYENGLPPVDGESEAARKAKAEEHYRLGLAAGSNLAAGALGRIFAYEHPENENDKQAGVTLLEKAAKKSVGDAVVGLLWNRILRLKELADKDGSYGEASDLAHSSLTCVSSYVDSANKKLALLGMAPPNEKFFR